MKNIPSKTAKERVQNMKKWLEDLSNLLLELPKMAMDLPVNLVNLSFDIFENPEKIVELTKLFLWLPNRTLNKFVKTYFIVYANMQSSSFEQQEDILSDLLDKCQDTMFGQRYGFRYIKTIEDFQNQVPISHYHDFEPRIHYMLKGEPNVTYPGKIDRFATSSGTTADSKYIPITKEWLKKSHFRPSTEVFGYYLKANPRTQFIKGKWLVIGGWFSKNPYTGEENIGFISAILQKETPWIGKILKEPGDDVSSIEPWEDKLDAIIKHTVDKDITFINGSPGWLLNVMYKVLEYTGKKTILEVRPHLELFYRGGLPITLYKSQFETLIPNQNMKYYQIYNASEWFFGIQCENDVDDMLLLTDHGTFYEWIPIEEYGKQNPKVLTLDQVEIGKEYVMLITNYSGLRRYVLGDIIVFTALEPRKIKVAGRTKYFIDMLGERVFLEHIEKAVFETCKKTDTIIAEYTVWPHVYTTESDHRWAHERIIEFVKKPESMESFTQILDQELLAANIFYEDERLTTKVLGSPIVHAAQAGTFYSRFKTKKNLSNQHKVPKLSNDRKILDEILAIMNWTA